MMFAPRIQQNMYLIYIRSIQKSDFLRRMLVDSKGCPPLSVKTVIIIHMNRQRFFLRDGNHYPDNARSRAATCVYGVVYRHLQ